MNKDSDNLLRLTEIAVETSSVKCNKLSLGISKGDVYEIDRAGMELINEGCNIKMLSLIGRAQVLVNSFQSLNRGMNMVMEDASEKNYYYPKLNIHQTKGLSFTIEWFKTNYYSNPKTGEHFIRPQRIQKIEKNYNLKHFKNAPDWVKPHIMSFEKEFQQIRQEYEEFKLFKRSFLKLIRHHNAWVSQIESRDAENPLKNFSFIGINRADIKV